MRKNSRHSPHTVVQPNLNQSHLINQIIAFIELDSNPNNPLKPTQRHTLQAGCCHGLSLVFSYMCAIEKSQWWLECLETLSSWNGKDPELQYKKHLSQSESSNGESVYHIITRIIHYVLFHQVTSSGIPEFNQTRQVQLTNPNSQSIQFESQTHQLEQQSVASGYFSENDLDQLLLESAFNVPSIMTASIHAKGNPCAHTIALHYIQGNNTWALYDPNSPDGALNFTKKSDLIHHMIHRYTANIRLEYLSLEPSPEAHTAQHHFKTAYHQICYNNPLTLIQSYGYVIADQTDKLIAALGNISQQLTSGSQDSACQIIDKLTSLTAQGDTQLINAMCVNQPFYEKMLSLSKTSSTARLAILQSLFTINRDNNSGYKQLACELSTQQASNCLRTCLSHTHDHAEQPLITLMESLFHKSHIDLWRESILIINEPNLLVFLLRLAEHSTPLRETITLLLSGKNKQGQTGLEKIIALQPDCFCQLITVSCQTPSLTQIMTEVLNTQATACTQQVTHPFTDAIMPPVLPSVKTNKHLFASMQAYYTRVQQHTDTLSVLATPLAAPIVIHTTPKPATTKPDALSQADQKAMAHQLLQLCLQPVQGVIEKQAVKNYLNKHLLKSLITGTITSTASIAHLLEGKPQEAVYQRYLTAIDALIHEGCHQTHSYETHLSDLERTGQLLTRESGVSLFVRLKTSSFTQQRKKILELIDTDTKHQSINRGSHSDHIKQTTLNPLMRSCLAIAMNIQEWYSLITIPGLLP